MNTHKHLIRLNILHVSYFQGKAPERAVTPADDTDAAAAAGGGGAWKKKKALGSFFKVLPPGRDTGHWAGPTGEVEGIPEVLPTALQPGKEISLHSSHKCLVRGFSVQVVMSSPACAHPWNQTKWTDWCSWLKTFRRLQVADCREPGSGSMGLGGNYFGF